MSQRSAFKTFEDSVNHSYSTYRFCISILPKAASFTARKPVKVGGFLFERQGQADAMRVELGWAFFTRIEAAFEAFTLTLMNGETSSVFEILLKSGDLTQHELNGLTEARDIRNILHHGDGNSDLLDRKPRRVKTGREAEPHLLEEHMADYVTLFVKAAKILAKPRLRIV